MSFTLNGLQEFDLNCARIFAVHPHAGVVRSVPLHGNVIAEGNPVGAACPHHVHARQVPTRLRLPAPRSSRPLPSLHLRPGPLSGRSVDHQVHPQHLHHLPAHGAFQL